MPYEIYFKELDVNLTAVTYEKNVQFKVNLNEKIRSWLISNDIIYQIKNIKTYPDSLISNSEPKYQKIVFQNEEDYLLFKLTWM